VATKSDLDLALQVHLLLVTYKHLLTNNCEKRHEVQPDVYCKRLGLQMPVAVSMKTGQIADVFHAICSVAMNPLSSLDFNVACRH